MALGHAHGRSRTSDELAAGLLAAGRASGDGSGGCRWSTTTPTRSTPPSPTWPTWPRDAAGGLHHAALFLREFTGGRPWAHLDIAGAARVVADEGSSPRAPPGSASACCCAGSAGPGRYRGLTAASRPSPTGSSSGTSRSSWRTSSPAPGWRRSPGRRWPGSATRPPERVVERHDAAGPQQPQGGGQIVGVLLLVRVAEHQVVAAVGEPGQHIEALPVISRNRPPGIRPPRTPCGPAADARARRRRW